MATKSAQAQDTSLFEVALKTLMAACGVTPTFIMSQAPGKGDKASTAVSAVAPGAEATFVVPYEVKGLKNPIEVDTEFFSAALKSVRNGSITYSQSSLVLKNARSDTRVNSADVDSAPKIVMPSPDTEGLQTFTLTPELHAFLTNKLPQLKLEKTFAQAPDITAIIKLRKGKAQLITYEKHQFCVWTGAAEGTPDLDLALPYVRFLSLIKDLPVANCEMLVTPDVLIAKSASFRIRIALPAVDPEDAIPPSVAYPRIKELAAATGKEISLNATELQTALDTAKSLVSNGTLVHFASTDKGVEVKVESSKGVTKSTFSSTGAISKPFALDYRYVMTLLQKNTVKVTKKTKGGEDVDVPMISFCVVQQGALIVSKANVTYISALGVSDSDE